MRWSARRCSPRCPAGAWRRWACWRRAAGGSYTAALRLSGDWWVYTWIWVALVGAALGVGTMALKAARTQQAVWTGLGRRAIFSFCPAVLAAMILTEMLYESGLERLMPGTWLLLYGVAICAAGAYSVRIVPLIGLCFMLLSTAAFYSAFSRDTLLGPMYAADIVLALGFGGFHIVFGLIIARRYGG